MTDTTDISALREHNQHIIAHLTRSNPRRPLNYAEVLTLESAKLVVASLSVRGGLPDVDHSEYWFEHEGKLLFDGALFNSRVAIFIDSQLEAERQRADYGQQVINQRNAECDRLINEMAALKAQLANPVVLPAKLPDEGYGGDAVRNWCRNESVAMCAKAIREAGFTVKGE